MRKFYMLLLVATFTPLLSFGQYFDVGVFAGTSNYMGDLVPGHQVWDQNHISLGVFGRYNISRRFAVKASFYKGHLSGSDNNAETSIRRRNLSFKTDLYEVGIRGEFNILKFDIFESKIPFSPYLFGGVAGFHFNPEAQFDGKWVELQPLGTEGQGMPEYGDPYSLWQVAIPAGLGLKFGVNEITTFGIELGMRKTFTDYIDDVSTTYPDVEALEDFAGYEAASLSYRTPEFNQDLERNPTGRVRGNPEMNDVYFFGGVTISINIAEDRYFD